MKLIINVTMSVLLLIIVSSQVLAYLPYKLKDEARNRLMTDDMVVLLLQEKRSAMANGMTDCFYRLSVSNAEVAPGYVCRDNEGKILFIMPSVVLKGVR